MIDRVGRDDVRPGAVRPAGARPEVGTTTPPVGAAKGTPYVALLLDVLRAHPPGEPTEELGALFGASLRLAALDALGRQALVPTPAPPPPAPPAPAATGPALAESSRPLAVASRPMPSSEEAIIKETAHRAGIDADFLRAIRRVENGRAGREFGVLSVSAPTYRDQASVAAETVRRNVGRYEQRTGRHAIDPSTGRYTAGFIQFFSGRYAPVGAANDPTGLNRYHARNLLRAYGVQPTDSATV